LKQAAEFIPGRFRFEGEEEAAGAAVAVILEGITNLDLRFVGWQML
jgi:hypothetical protein